MQLTRSEKSNVASVSLPNRSGIPQMPTDVKARTRNDVKQIVSEGIHNLRFADLWSEAVDYTWQDVAEHVERYARAAIEYHVVGTNITYRQIVDEFKSEEESLRISDKIRNLTVPVS